MRVNFDANASITPISEVLEAIRSYSGQFLNPSSVHLAGQAAKSVLDEARDEISQLLNLRSNDKIIFTSGATEANNAALAPTRVPTRSGNPDLLCSAVEHSAVLECFREHARNGYFLKEISPATLIDPDLFKKEVPEDLLCFAVMAANNETGQIFDVKSFAGQVRKISPRTRIHCDAVQAVGKLPIDFQSWGIDSLALSGHKIGALSGVGALVVVEHCEIPSWMQGGPQGLGLRAGTENVLGIQSLAIACRVARKRMNSEVNAMQQAKDSMLNFFKKFGDKALIHSFNSEQLPNTISVRFPGIKADDLVVALDLCGLAVSAGSACASGRPSPSHVLLAHGLSPTEARETIRISFEPNVSQSDVQSAQAVFAEALERMSRLQRAA